ncbi:response regulator transcription factor [Leisingera sp. D0M16]|uniref:response regulator transcription factor n=1 Tax=Leisingera coralii TaxID=3351347 RepID=UPI003B7C27A1
MQQIEILVVDDEAPVREALRQGLEPEGWTVREAWDREGLFAALEAYDIDLVTLDIGLGQQDGLDLARELRQQRNIPILMITGKAHPFDRVRGLECGADDYIVKPFHIREVVLRTRKTLERYRGASDLAASVRFGNCEFDAKARLVRDAAGTPIDLTGTELQLLELFLRNPGRVLSRDEISQAVLGRKWAPLDRTVDGHVARLRHKIEPGGEAPLMIRSVRGVGYVFSGEVTPLAARF